MGVEKGVSSYGQAFRDYFREFRRGFSADGAGTMVLLLAVGVACMGGFTAHGLGRNWVMGIPLLFTLVSGAVHRVSLPVMMYLVPCSRRQREAYIQRMLIAKIAVPMGVGFLCDVAALCLGMLSAYALLLQMTGIFFLSCLCGMLNDDAAEKRAAYGGMRYFVSAILVICYIGGVALAVICAGAVSRGECMAVLVVMAFLFLPVLAAAGKRWRRIRSNFADYETAMRLEDA